MKQYFIGPVRKVFISNIVRDNNNVMDYTREDKVVFDDELFYYNCIGKLICDKTREALFTEEEIDDVICFSLSENKKASSLSANSACLIFSSFETLYVNREELKRTDYKKTRKIFSKTRSKK